MNWLPALQVRRRSWESLAQATASADAEVEKAARELKEVATARQKSETALQKAEAELRLA